MKLEINDCYKNIQQIRFKLNTIIRDLYNIRNNILHKFVKIQDKTSHTYYNKKTYTLNKKLISHKNHKIRQVKLINFYTTKINKNKTANNKENY